MPVTNKTCTNCGQPFNSGKATRAYCSKPCRQQAYRLRKAIPDTPTTLQTLAALPGLDTAMGEQFYAARLYKGYLSIGFAQYYCSDNPHLQQQWDYGEKWIEHYLYCYLRVLVDMTRRRRVKVSELCALHQRMETEVFTGEYLSLLPAMHHLRGLMHFLQDQMMQLMGQLHPDDTTVRLCLHPATRTVILSLLHHVQSFDTPHSFDAHGVPPDFHYHYLCKLFPGRYPDEQPTATCYTQQAA
jgi:hypothetical protein